MNKKVTRNILKILLVIQIVLTVLPSFILASDTDVNVGYFMPRTPSGGGSAIVKARVVMSVISTIGAIVSVITLMALGIKYMLGSVEQKAEYKKVFLPYVVGAILLFAIPTIISTAYNLMLEMEVATYESGPGGGGGLNPIPTIPVDQPY